MKTTFIDIRQKCKIIKTYKFKGDVSVMVGSHIVTVLEHDNGHYKTDIDLKSDETISVRNWGK